VAAGEDQGLVACCRMVAERDVSPEHRFAGETTGRELAPQSTLGALFSGDFATGEMGDMPVGLPASYGGLRLRSNP